MNVTLLCLALAQAAPPSEVVDRVAAVVNDAPILLSEVQSRAAPEIARLNQEPIDAQEQGRRREEMLREALQVLVDEQLLQEQVKEFNSDVTDDQLDAAIEDVKKQNSIPDDATFEKALAHEGLTLQSYRQALRRDLEKRKLLNTKVHSQAKVTDEDLRAEYERTYVQAGGEDEVHARHILLQLKRDATPAEDAAVKARAVEIVQRIRAGADFAKLAHDLSDGPSASQGGDLGYFKRGVMVAEFENVAFGLPLGGVSDPVRTQFGWHIIQVLDRRKAPPVPFESVKEQLRQKLAKLQIDRLTQDYLASLRKDAAVDIKIELAETAPRAAEAVTRRRRAPGRSARASGSLGRPTVAVSLGNPFGIGPEVLAVALTHREVVRRCRPLVFGDRTVLERAAALRGIRLPESIEIVALSALGDRRFRFGVPQASAARWPIAYLEAAVVAVQTDRAQALCTAPIHKGRMVAAGFGFAGHTDFLRERFRVPRVVMMLAGPTLRVALATVHVPLVDVSRRLTIAGLVETLKIVDEGLRQDFGIPVPKIAVTGVNPHAGEDGLLGMEEIRIVAPAVARARRRGLGVTGPFPADSLFARQVRTREFDAILAMSHDQGLGPLKVVDFDRAVNVTLGLPKPRTSPDHGTADDIAGKGVADPTSMIEALLLAAELAPRAGSRR